MYMYITLVPTVLSSRNDPPHTSTRVKVCTMSRRDILPRGLFHKRAPLPHPITTKK